MAEPLPDWHVDSANVHQETTLGTGNSGLVTQWVVPFVLDSGPAKGSTHEVRVDPRDFTASGVADAIKTSLNDIHGVTSLTSGNA